MQACLSAAGTHLHGPILQLRPLHGLRDLIQMLLQICDALIPLQHSSFQLQHFLAEGHAVSSQSLQLLLQVDVNLKRGASPKDQLTVCGGSQGAAVSLQHSDSPCRGSSKRAPCSARAMLSKLLWQAR